MALLLKSVRLGAPRRRGEGLRIGTVRYLPRGVRKSDYARLDYFDVWVPILAPSPELVKKAKSQKTSAKTFFQLYRSEMQRGEGRHVIELLARLAEKTPISIGCYCENESACHRSELLKLIQAARSRPA